MKFYIPAEFKKSKDDKEMRIYGLASTPDLDRDNEEVVQKGLDISDFLDYGYFNYNHDNSYILGYPDKEKTKITKDGLYVEGNILPTDIGKRIWDTAVVLQKSNAPRKLGFSIEGKVLQKDDKGRILKAKVYNVAITNTPVNTKATWQALVKSLTSANGENLIPESVENASRFLTRIKRGDENSLEILEELEHLLNTSKDKRAVRAYLSMMKGIYGEDLEETVNKIMEMMEER